MTLAVSSLATQIAPAPTASADGRPPTSIRFETFPLVRSMRATVSSTADATQTAPEPTATATAALPTSYCFRTLFCCRVELGDLAALAVRDPQRAGAVRESGRLAPDRDRHHLPARAGDPRDGPVQPVGDPHRAGAGGDRARVAADAVLGHDPAAVGVDHADRVRVDGGQPGAVVASEQQRCAPGDREGGERGGGDAAAQRQAGARGRPGRDRQLGGGPQLGAALPAVGAVLGQRARDDVVERLRQFRPQIARARGLLLEVRVDRRRLGARAGTAPVRSGTRTARSRARRCRPGRRPARRGCAPVRGSRASPPAGRWRSVAPAPSCPA